MQLNEVFQWYLAEQEIVHDITSFFCEELNLSDETSDELFTLVAEERLTVNDFVLIIENNYGDTLCVEVFIDLIEQTEQAELIRKRRIERSRKELGAQFKPSKGDTDTQRLQKSTLSLSTFKIDKQGKFIQRKTKGDPNKIRKDLEAKRARSKSTKGKVDSAKAAERRKKQSKVGGKFGAAKFVQNLKLAS